MNTEQNDQGQERMQSDQDEEKSRGPETAEELKAQVEARKQEMKRGFDEVTARGKEWSAKFQGSDSTASAELDQLDQEAQTVVAEANAALDQLDTEELVPSQEGVAEIDPKELAKISVINQKVQEMIEANPGASKESIEETRKQFEKIVNFDASKIDSGINKLYAEDYEQKAAHWSEEKVKLEQQLQGSKDPEANKSIEAKIKEADEFIQTFNTSAAERRAMLDDSSEGKTDETVVDSSPAMEPGKTYTGAKEKADVTVDMSQALEVQDQDEEAQPEEATSEATAAAEAPIPKSVEKLMPNFELKTVKIEKPLDEWTDQEIQSILIPHLQKMISSLEASKKTASSMIQAQSRIDDAKVDLTNVQNFSAERAKQTAK